MTSAAATAALLHPMLAYLALLGSRGSVAVPLVAAALTPTLGTAPWARLSLPVIGVAIALTLEWYLTFPERRAARLFALRPVPWFGALSYSLYLWQQLFLNRQSASRFTEFALTLLTALVVAMLSVYLVERPSLRWRERFERRRARARAAVVA